MNTRQIYRLFAAFTVSAFLLPTYGCSRGGRTIVRTAQHSKVHSSGQKSDPEGGGCPGNLQNIATACEMFSCDNQGRYPQKLGDLVPKYLKELPKCPTAGKDTYSESYVVNNTPHPQLFTMCCSGKNHSKEELGENLPSYNSTAGLVLK